MNERIFAVVILFAALCLSLYSIFASRLQFSLEQLLGVVLSIGTLLVAYWLYVDYEHHGEDMEYLGSRIGELGKNLDAKIIAETHIQEKKNTWVCPNCKAINFNEDTICHHCKRPISQTT
jgi:predicted acyltransferase